MKNSAHSDTTTEAMARKTARLSARALFVCCALSFFATSERWLVALLVFSVIALASMAAAMWRLELIAQAHHRAWLCGRPADEERCDG